jgi:hypothetical protein
MRLLWSRVCLAVNLTCVLIAMGVFATALGCLFTEFNDLPETDIWVSHRCNITGERLTPSVQDSPSEASRSRQASQAHSTLFRVDVVATGQIGLCAISYQLGEFANSSVDCKVPPNPLLFDQCSTDSSIQQLTLLSSEASIIDEQLHRHIAIYWSAWASGIVWFLCCVWCCYSYVFYCCSCRESNYFCCGQSKDEYQTMWDNFNFGTTDDFLDETSILEFKN